MNQVQLQKNKIINVSFGINILFLIISMFYYERFFTFIIILTNILFLGTYFILTKYAPLVEGMLITNKVFNNLNKKLEELE